VSSVTEQASAAKAINSDSPILYALPGFLGSLFLTVGAFGVGWFPLAINALRWPLINYMQTSTVGLALSRSFVVVGTALLLQAWLIVGVDALRGRITGLRTMYVTLTAWCLPLLVAPPLFSRDVYSYYMQGRLQLAGHNPYLSGVSLVPGWFRSGVDPLWADAPTPYGPVFLQIEKTVASISGESSLLAAYLLRLVAVAGVAVMAWVIPRLARKHGINAVPALWLAVMNPMVIMHFVAGAHNDSLLIAAMCAALLLALYEHPNAALVMAAIGLGIKPVGIVLIPFVALIIAGPGASIKLKLLTCIRACVVTAIVMVGTSAVVGVGPLGWIGALSTPGSVRSWLSPSTAIGMMWGGFLQVLGLGNLSQITISLTRTIGAIALGVVLVTLVLRPSGRSAARGSALAFLSLVLLGPVAQPWYLLWAMPLLAATGLTRHQVRICVITIAAFTVHGLATWGATADTFVELSDGVAVIVASATLALAVLASPQERQLILGTKIEQGLMPRDDPARARARAQIL
jgi:alpha-1,6-mannosyltransferase